MCVIAKFVIEWWNEGVICQTVCPIQIPFTDGFWFVTAHKPQTNGFSLIFHRDAVDSDGRVCFTNLETQALITIVIKRIIREIKKGRIRIRVIYLIIFSFTSKCHRRFCFRIYRECEIDSDFVD